MTNEEQILAILKENQEILKAAYKSAEKTRKYFLYSAVITILMFVIPLIGLVIAIPIFMNTYMESLNGI